MAMQTINPTTGEVIQEYEETSGEELQNILDRLPNAQQEWSARKIEDRAKILRKVAQNLRDRKAEYARLMADEIGHDQSWIDEQVELYEELAQAYILE